MEHFIKDNIYYIMDGDKELLKIKLVDEVDGNQVIISTENEVFAGPIKFLTFTPETK